MEKSDKYVEKNWKLYKMNLVIDKTAMDIHHILGQKYRDKYNVYVPENKIKIPRWEHVDYNNFVREKQNPREAMQKLYEMCKQVLSHWVREVFETVLYKTDDDLFYIPEVIKWKKKKNGTKKATTEKNADTDWQSNDAEPVCSKPCVD